MSWYLSRFPLETKQFWEYNYRFQLFFHSALWHFPTASTTTFFVTLRKGQPLAILIIFILFFTSSSFDCVILGVQASPVFPSDFYARKFTTGTLLARQLIILFAPFGADSKLWCIQSFCDRYVKRNLFQSRIFPNCIPSISVHFNFHG